MLNTYFSLVASTLATFVLSPVLYEESTLRMVGPLLGQTQVSCTVRVPSCRDGKHEYTRGTRGCLLGFLRFVKTQFDPRGSPNPPSPMLMSSTEPIPLTTSCSIRFRSRMAPWPVRP